MSIILGITGGIGSGKSTVSKILGLNNIPVYVADDESKRLTNSSVEIKEQLMQLFGRGIYENDHLDKKLLASHIFGDKEALLQVNSIIHPIVKKDFCEWCISNEVYSVVAIESAILFESGFQDAVNKSVLVYAPLNMKIDRILDRDGTTYEKALERIQNQMPDEEKMALSDYIIINDESESLIAQTMAIIKNLK